MEQGFFPYFPPLKPRYILWSGASYSLKNMVYFALIRTTVCAQSETTILEAYAWLNLFKSGWVSL